MKKGRANRAAFRRNRSGERLLLRGAVRLVRAALAGQVVDALDLIEGQLLEGLRLEGDGVAGGVVEQRAVGVERRAAVRAAVRGGVGGRLRRGPDLRDR